MRRRFAEDPRVPAGDTTRMLLILYRRKTLRPSTFSNERVDTCSRNASNCALGTVSCFHVHTATIANFIYVPVTDQHTIAEQVLSVSFWTGERYALNGPTKTPGFFVAFLITYGINSCTSTCREMCAHGCHAEDERPFLFPFFYCFNTSLFHSTRYIDRKDKKN